jgi:hypothetical protein
VAGSVVEDLELTAAVEQPLGDLLCGAWKVMTAR